MDRKKITFYRTQPEKETDLVRSLQNQQLTAEQKEAIQSAATTNERVVEVLKTVQDPELPVNIWDLGLIYDIAVDEAERLITVQMTLTAPGCPVAGAMPIEVEKRLLEYVPGIEQADVKLVWEPAWNKSMLSDEAKLLLDLW